MGESRTTPVDFPAEFLRHHRSLWLVAMSVVGNRADADDVVQEAAIIGIRKVGSFEPGTSFRAWMGEIVRNVALNRRRQVHRERRRFGAGFEAQHLEEPGRATASLPIDGHGSLLPYQEAIDDVLLDALMTLDSVARACILLRCVEGLDYSEISQVLGIPKGTAMSHVFRCRRALGGLLGATNDRAR